MEINIQACEISFNLDHTIEVAGEGDFFDAKKILFRQPNRACQSTYQQLAASFNRAMALNLTLLEKLTSKEEMDKAKADALEKNNNNVSPLVSMEETTAKDIETDVEGILAMMTSLDWDFDIAYKKFDKILLSNTKDYNICSIGGKPLKETHLEKIHYQDYLKMLAVYLSFFGRPAKVGIKKESEQQLGSVMQAKAV